MPKATATPKKAKKPTIKTTKKRTTNRKTKKPLKVEHSEEFVQREEDEKVIVQECLDMQKSIDDALHYIKEKGFKMAKTKYFQIKNLLKEEKLRAFHRLALEDGIIEHNADLILSFNHIKKKMWEQYENAKDGSEKASILSRLAEILVYGADSVDVVKEIIREQAELKEAYKHEATREDPIQVH